MKCAAKSDQMQCCVPFALHYTKCVVQSKNWQKCKLCQKCQLGKAKQSNCCSVDFTVWSTVEWILCTCYTYYIYVSVQLIIRASALAVANLFDPPTHGRVHCTLIIGSRERWQREANAFSWEWEWIETDWAAHFGNAEYKGWERKEKKKAVRRINERRFKRDCIETDWLAMQSSLWKCNTDK